jgi:hypothetical protein
MAYWPTLEAENREPQMIFAKSLVCAALWLQALTAPDVTKYPPSNEVYRLVFLPAAEIQIDGELRESAWAKANVLRRFIYASGEPSPPSTEFRALCTRDWLYFHFTVEDPDVVVLPTLRDEEDIVLEDRVEIYFARDDRLEEYYCFEVDSRGRVFDYRASYYRRFQTDWNWDQLEVRAKLTPRGYDVEGRIPVRSLEQLGLGRLEPGRKIRVGLYRAEFSHDRSGKPVEHTETIHNRGRSLDGPPPIERWITWIDPKTPEPDFHVPSSLGWFEVVEAAN